MAAQWYPPVMDSAAQENSESRLGHPPGSTASYSYDAFGRRAEKIVGSRTTDYLYDAFGHDSYEVNNLCAPVCIDTGFFYLGGQLVAEYKEGRTYFVHTDPIGSTRLVTGLNQTVVQNLDYLPFGEQNSTDSGISTHEFTGDVHDAESNLDHAQFRQYSSTLGRWMHPDPAGLAAVDPSNPQSWNRYAYVDDDPLNLTDSSGLYPVCLGSSLFDQVDFYVDEKYQGSDLTYIGNLCGDQGQRLPPDRSGLLIHGGGGGGGGSGRGGGNGSGDNWWGTFAKEFFKLSGGPGNVPTCAGEALKQIAAEFIPFSPGGPSMIQATAPAGQAVAFNSAVAQTETSVGAYIAARGLTVPLRSSVVRGMIAQGAESAVAAGAKANVAVQTLAVDYAAIKSTVVTAGQARSGQCAAAFPIF